MEEGSKGGNIKTKKKVIERQNKEKFKIEKKKIKEIKRIGNRFQ
jgi:hypothetical protein